MTLLAGIIPAEHAAGHTLVLPCPDGPVAVSPMASAWFSDVAWLREPSRASGARKMTGARFRGIQQAESVTPGVMRLGEEHIATGPFAVEGERLAEISLNAPKAEAYVLSRSDGLRDVRAAAPTSYDDRDGIARSFPQALPQGEELRVIQWAVAAARKTGGVLLGDGLRLMAPDPFASVNLGLYSAHPLAAGDVLPLLRAFIATAEVGADHSTPDGSPRYRLVGPTAYDGSMVIDVERVDRVPRALGALDWRAYGPFAYRMNWFPADPYELELEQPSGLHVIARARMRSSIARLAMSLQSRIAGVVVDDGGFVAGAEDLETRSDPPASSGSGRAWV
ncbi:hypothetical protein GCM10027059_05290 [Myceligenerans halotolerans]